MLDIDRKLELQLNALPAFSPSKQSLFLDHTTHVSAPVQPYTRNRTVFRANVAAAACQQP